MRSMKLVLVCCGIAAVAACNVSSSPELAGANPAGCRAVASASPSTTSMAVGQSVNIALSVEQGCPAPILRNETPTIIQIDSASLGFVRATGLAPGTGRLTVRSGVDTLIATTVSITVTP
jgi:hypothetical protein